jgi:hypothetical protein
MRCENQVDIDAECVLRLPGELYGLRVCTESVTVSLTKNCDVNSWLFGDPV